MSEKINLVVINNPFYPNDRTIKQIEYSAVATLAGYVNQAGIDPDVEIVVSVNGRVIPKREWTTTSILPGSYVVICPAIQDGGGDSNPVAVIAGIALSVVTMGVGSWISGGAFWGAGALAPTAWTFGGFLAATATMFLGGMLLSHMMPQPKIDSLQQESPTYSWAKLQAMQGQGNPIAITYGTVRSAGQVLAQHVSSDGDKQYLNLLLSAGDGPLDEISDITINENPAENYSNVQIDIRLGTNDQTVIPNFGDQFADQPLSYELTDNYVVQQTEGNANQGLEITVECPAGLYHVNDNGSLGDASVTITADYRLVGAQNWTPWGTWTITDHKQTGVRRAFRVDNLPAGKYEVRVKCSAKSGTTTRDATRVYWTQLTGIMYDDLCRPNRALIGIRALATDQLNGAPSISWIQKRLNVWVWNPNTNAYEQKPANNPAWACYDLIHRAKQLKDVRTGQYVFKVLGAPADRLIYQEFADWAQFCTERGLEVNILIDTASDLWTALRDIENVGRGKVVIKGTRFGAICDKPATPVQLFTMGNIVQGSFKEEFLSVRDRANAIEVTFNNKDKNYQRDTITVFGDDWNTATTVKNPTQISLNGITSLEQAYKEAKYRLRLNKYLIRTVSFEAAVDAIACQVGDVILVQHDVPKWGAGGRLLGAAGNSVTLDRAVAIDPAKGYEVMVRSADDVLQTRTVAKPVPTLTRSSIAYLPDGTQVAAGVPRFYNGGIMVEEGTTNLVTNGSFETDSNTDGMADSWFVWIRGSGDTSRTYNNYRTTALFGSGYAQHVEITGQSNTNPSALSQSGIAVSPNTIYTFSFYGRASIANKVGFSIQWRDSSATLIAENSATQKLGTTISRVSFTATAPSNAATVWLVIFGITAVGEWMEVDAVQLEAKPYATSFIDGTRSAETLTIPTAGVLNTQEGTVEFLINLSGDVASSAPIAQHIFIGHNTGNIYATTNRILISRVSSTGEWRFQLANELAQSSEIRATWNPSPGWHQITAKWSGTEMVLFGDGVRLGSIANPYLPSQLGASLYVGSWVDGAQQADCLIKNLRISNRARTDAEIAAAYANGYTADQDTTAYIPFASDLHAEAQIISSSTAFSSQPAADDVYTFGETNISAKPFRVVNITRSSDQNRRITALEYIDAAYQEATDVPQIPYTQSGPAPSGLSVTDQLDASGQAILLITWRPPRGSFTGYRIEVDGRRVATLGAEQTSYTYPIRSYKPYTIKVTALDGIADLGSISTTYTPSGAPPADIDNYIVLQNIRQLEHYWTPNVDTAAVEIRRLDPVLLSWESGTVINSGVTGSKLVDTNIGEGVLYFGIKAIGKNGLYSNNMKMAMIQITTIPSSNIVVAVDEMAILDGTCQNCFVDSGKITMDVADLWDEATTETWNEAAGSNDIWGAPAALSATYTTQIKDMGKVMTSLVYLELAYPLTYTVEWKYSDTDSTLASATWQKFIDGGSAKFRYYQLRITLTGDGTVRSVSKFKITVDVPDIVLKYPNEDVPNLEITDANAGVRIDFPQPFFKPPTITGSVLPGPGYIIPEVYEDYCIIRATTNGSDRITGKLHIQIIGY